MSSQLRCCSYFVAVLKDICAWRPLALNAPAATTKTPPPPLVTTLGFQLVSNGSIIWLSPDRPSPTTPFATSMLQSRPAHDKHTMLTRICLSQLGWLFSLFLCSFFCCFFILWGSCLIFNQNVSWRLKLGFIVIAPSAVAIIVALHFCLHNLWRICCCNFACFESSIYCSCERYTEYLLGQANWSI